ncbi:TetR/AcrR family transcriptional regulator [Trinickia mobilis]|uniref:TetR/AcrR family transcriptional regulator n=1 Tax=Trinickia mobilis TaxID=2816356 RepID=UPI001A8DD94A|nr:TetR/AcrR family transcriptional regulator [Trinickia mobilis]
MNSQKSTPNPGEAKAPRRARGHARVASLLEAAGAEFAEKGYEATTMTAIAARAESSIGSLYQFFPTKEQVAGTLIEQYVTELEAAFDRLSEEVPSLDASVVAGRLTTLFVAFRATHPAFVVLADAHDVVLPGATGVRERLRKGIASVLAALAPRLSAKEALFRAVVVQHLMKAAVALSHDASVAGRHAAMLEFQRVVQHYLEDVMEARCGRQTGGAQRGAARKGRSPSHNGAGPKSKGKEKP